MIKNRWISFFGVFALFVFIALGTVGGCHDNNGGGDGDGGPPPLDGDDGDGVTSVTIMNNQDVSADVYISFESTSCVTSEAWSSFCSEIDSSDLNCSFTLDANSSQDLPLTDTTCNAMFTIAFNAPPSQFCDKTQVEFNIYSNGTDTYDISLVNGFNEPVSITDGTEAGPVDCETGNQNVSGVFPLGCDGCAERLDPPCGFTPGDNSECHGGTQFDPDPPCQFTQPSGGSFTVNLNTPAPCPTPTPNPVPTCPPGTCGGCSSMNPFCCPATGGCADSVEGLSGCSDTICTIE
ncbi:MAG: hypothetical protein WBD99_03590 [Thermodesulfobacteriota bacterium]